MTESLIFLTGVILGLLIPSISKLVFSYVGDIVHKYWRV